MRFAKKAKIFIDDVFKKAEVKKAHNAGADFVKLFPSSSISYLKAIKAPLSHIKFLAVGGFLVNQSWIKAGNFDKITETATALVNNIEKFK